MKSNTSQDTLLGKYDYPPIPQEEQIPQNSNQPAFSLPPQQQYQQISSPTLNQQPYPPQSQNPFPQAYPNSAPPSYNQQLQPQYQSYQPIQQLQTPHVILINQTPQFPAQNQPKSLPIMCPVCKKQGITDVKYTAGSGTNILAIILFFICCPFFCCPYCCDNCKDVQHYCQCCGSFVGEHKFKLC